MGVVARQTLKKSILMIVGVLIAALCTIFIYPLNLELYGNLQFIISAASLLFPIAVAGIYSLVVKFFPQFNAGSKDNHGFLGLLFVGMLIALTVFGGLLFWGDGMYDVFFEKIGWSSSLYHENILVIFLFLSITAFYIVLQNYLTNYQRIVVPALLNEFWLKLMIPIVILLSIYTTVSDDILKFVFVLMKLLALLLLIAYAKKLGVLFLKVDWSFITSTRIKNMSEFAFFGILGSMGNMIAFRIDTIMVAGFTDFEKTGIYAVALYIGSIIEIPSRSIIPLVGAQISQLHSTNSIGKIEILYKRTSLSLLILGLGFLILIWMSVDFIFMIAPNSAELSSGKLVVLCIGLAKLVDLSFGINGPILSYGKYYKWNFAFVLIMAVLTISTNFYFIPRIGFEGAAIATLISLCLFNLIKYLFVLAVYRIQPFSMNTSKVIWFGVITLCVLYLLPSLSNPVLNIIMNSIIVVLLYAVPIYYFKVSVDINREVDKYVTRIIAYLD